MSLNILFQPKIACNLIDLPSGSINKAKLKIQFLPHDEGFGLEYKEKTRKNSPSSMNNLFYLDPTPGFDPEDTETIYVWLYS
jgi:hypothetical protein